MVHLLNYKSSNPCLNTSSNYIPLKAAVQYVYVFCRHSNDILWVTVCIVIVWSTRIRKSLSCICIQYYLRYMC